MVSCLKFNYNLVFNNDINALTLYRQAFVNYVYLLLFFVVYFSYIKFMT